MRYIVTIVVDREGNITVNYPKNVSTSQALSIIVEASKVVHQYKTQEDIAHRHHVSTMKKLSKLLKKQKQPDLN